MLLPCCSLAAYDSLEGPGGQGHFIRIHDMGGCHNYGPHIWCLIIIIGTQKGTIILTTTHISPTRHEVTPAIGIVDVNILTEPPLTFQVLL